MEERQTNYTIMEGYELPSKGLIYDKPVQAHVELRSMTGRDEMKRLSPSTTPLKTLADIIESCLIEKPAVHVYDMALGDYEYLLHKVRIVTYGPNYKMGIRCPYCGKEIDTEADLDSLELKEFDINRFNELRTFMLPKSNKLITVNFQTPRMLDEIEMRSKEMRRKMKTAEIDFDTLVLLVGCIDTVDGNKMEQFALENFINKLPAADMLKIINNINELNSLVGLSNDIILDCPYCDGEIKTFFRFGPEFFRPTNL